MCAVAFETVKSVEIRHKHTVIISFMDNKVLYGLLQFSSGAIVRCPFSHFALVSDYFTLFLIELNLVEN